MLSNLKSNRLPFSWAVGIESTFIPQERAGLRALEEYELMQHYQQWRDDLKRACSLGVSKIRWAVPWYKVEPEPGKFDWQWVDQVLDYMVRKLKLEPIVDLVHYGTPLWMDKSFIDPRYPEYVAAYQAAFARRYRGLVKYYTPLNEPTVNAEFSGRLGQWPPYLTGEHGYVRVLIQIARGIQLSARQIRQADPDAVLVAVESTHHYAPTSGTACEASEEAYLKDWLCWDLVAGLVSRSHPLYQYLIAHEASPEELLELERGAEKQDIFGVNFYPWSSHCVSVDCKGQEKISPCHGDGKLLADVLARCFEHTGCPVFVTETSAEGGQRLSWMGQTIEAVDAARSSGVPVVGYTWYPLFSMIEWAYRTTSTPIKDHFLKLGLFDVRLQNGVMVRESTPCADQYRKHVKSRPVRFAVAKLLRRRLWAALRGVVCSIAERIRR